MGELEPKWCSLGVSGQFHDLVKRRKNRLRASRAPSGGAPGRAQLVGDARHARRCLAGLVPGAGRGRGKCSQITPKAKRRRLTARLGAPSLQDKHSFAPLEPRLSGVDAVDSLIALLRRRLRHPGVPAADQLVPHGPIAAPLPLIPGYRLPDTAGVQ